MKKAVYTVTDNDIKVKFELGRLKASDLLEISRNN